ncbi:MAG: hypothetical protein AAB688_01215 [Patescibacteria group bacterium]
MTNCDTGNNFDRQNSYPVKDSDFVFRNKLVLTITFTLISLFVLGIQLMPYVYGGVSGHYHGSEKHCGWPYGSCKM